LHCRAHTRNRTPHPVYHPGILDPHGPKADEIASLWWIMLGLGTLVFALVVLLLGSALLAQRRPPALDERQLVRPGPLASVGSNALVVVAGLAVPALILMGLLVVDLRTLAAIAQPPSPPRVHINVTGHQFWWEVRYADADVVSANEVHVPTGEPVQLALTAADVIHTFWVPQLLGKLDMLPYQTNTTWLQADQPGVYRGECAEFCGAQHAHMDFLVVAEPPDQAAQWLEAQRQPAHPANDATTALGLQTFSRVGCISCHAIRFGTTAIGGRIGPDLTHVGSRRTLAAGTLANTPTNMSAWIADPQAIKPGNAMPAIALDAESLRALATYLESLQ
jgi:cytochrome c oxidase subunit 2